MRFVDASVFVHAFIKPKRKLKEHEVRIKEAAKKIVKRINEGEEMAISTVQVAEIANLLEHYMPIDDALSIEMFLLTARNVRVHGVEKADCVNALEVAKDTKVGLSDAIAFVIMKENGLKEAYSFDHDFDRLNVKRITE
ncbi:MAG: hypothetical protein AEth_01765 [Candidatus Argoarchaeum ethanivorans]|uniref:PIN domain-containing protein n=1 Tax=Candidatus Argoarchaeum ethanivorans TaxID=2608793 RepID=A0A8B3RZU2_9EURY|nr:MAG: hypothetical protein AEth_01765 [Candidatus Argoarchaeum ethanivorans]